MMAALEEILKMDWLSQIDNSNGSDSAAHRISKVLKFPSKASIIARQNPPELVRRFIARGRCNDESVAYLVSRMDFRSLAINGSIAASILR